jgi:hypothetical protein
MEVLHLNSLPALSSLEGGPLVIGGYVTFFNCPKITSLTGVGKKYFKQVGTEIYPSQYITNSILGTLTVKGLKQLNTRKSTDKLKQALMIVNQHLKGDKDVMECHEELTRAGLKEFAKL